MKKIIIIATALLIGGCSTTKTTAVNTEINNNITSYKQNFIKLVTFLRTPGLNPKEADAIKVKALALAYDAGMYRECDKNRKCVLVFNGKKITIDEHYINVENPDKSYAKIENLEAACRYIYNN